MTTFYVGERLCWSWANTSRDGSDGEGGSGSTKRTSALRAAIDRQTATHGEAASERDARSQRIRTAKRDVERALRSREQL